MKNGYSVNIYFQDWTGGVSYGISKDDDDSLSLDEYKEFCWNAGQVYGFTKSQMDNMINWESNNDTNK